MNKPKISVIVPVYNGQDYLCGSLDSLLASSYENLEIILVDNGSTDESGRICDGYAHKDGRITVLHTENNGVSAARNAGLDAASGEWIGFFDSDDKIEPDMYEYLVSAATSQNAEIVQCGVYKEFPDKCEIVNCPKEAISISSTEEMSHSFWQHFAYSVWSKIYKSELAKAIRFDQEYIIGEDLRYNFEAVVRSRKTLLLPLPKYHYMQRVGSVCYSAPNMQNATSFRNMLLKSENDFSDKKTIVDFIFAERMRNNAHICSRIVLSEATEFDGFVKEVRKEIKNEFSLLKKSKGIAPKDKLKLTLIAYCFGVYKFLLRMIK